MAILAFATGWLVYSGVNHLKHPEVHFRPERRCTYTLLHFVISSIILYLYLNLFHLRIPLSIFPEANVALSMGSTNITQTGFLPNCFSFAAAPVWDPRKFSDEEVEQWNARLKEKHESSDVIPPALRQQPGVELDRKKLAERSMQ